jgi:hypothetical protein
MKDERKEGEGTESRRKEGQKEGRKEGGYEGIGMMMPSFRPSSTFVFLLSVLGRYPFFRPPTHPSFSSYYSVLPSFSFIQHPSFLPSFLPPFIFLPSFLPSFIEDLPSFLPSLYTLRPSFLP